MSDMVISKDNLIAAINWNIPNNPANTAGQFLREILLDFAERQPDGQPIPMLIPKPGEQWRVCPTCGGTFLKKSRNQQYCSENCRPSSKNTRTLCSKTCPTCRRGFRTYNANKKYCSITCSRIAQKLLAPNGIGRRVRTARINAGLTQAQLAELIGMSPQSISQIETKSNNVRMKTLNLIAGALDINPADIAALKPAPSNEQIRPLRKKPLAKLIRAAMRAKGITNHDLADKIGVEPATVSAWRNGVSVPRAAKRAAIAKELGIDPVKLLEAVDAQTPPNNKPIPSPEKIKAARQAAGLTRTELAEMVKLCKHTIDKFETGHSVPGPKSLRRIAKATGVEINDLTIKPDSKEPEKKG